MVHTRTGKALPQARFDTNMSHAMNPALCLKMILLRAIPKTFFAQLQKKGRVPVFFDPKGPRGPHNAAWVQVYLGVYAVGVLGTGRLALMSMRRGVHVYPHVYPHVYTQVWRAHKQFGAPNHFPGMNIQCFTGAL